MDEYSTQPTVAEKLSKSNNLVAYLRLCEGITKPGYKPGFFFVHYYDNRLEQSGLFNLHNLTIKPDATSGLFNNLLTISPDNIRAFFFLENPMLASAPRRPEPHTYQLIKQLKPEIKQPSPELLLRAEKIKAEVEADAARNKLAIAEMFLAGPVAWPDYPDCEEVN